ncbi:hypothetical protein [Alcanivorax sp. S71-1-4]|uniref:hypothetical protein n=1 Tax=Alcanivorax sp. S71-1-4 TaxID=1177159 RepID=UPI00135B2C86|nr:hypothetical protein [Alcanivorax sp. S71-1-4]
MKLNNLIMVFIGMAFSGGASASGPLYYNVNGGASEQLDVTPIYDHFSGTYTWRNGFCTVDCALSADVSISEDSNGVTSFLFSSPVSGGNFFCSTLTFSPTAWSGSVPTPISVNDSPIAFTVSGIEQSSLCGVCSDQMDIYFHAEDGGYFSFDGPIAPNGTCSLKGEMSSSNYYEFWN